MGTLTPNSGLYKPATNETGWGALVDANFDVLDDPYQIMVPASSQHVAASLGALLDDLYSLALALKANATSGFGFGGFGENAFGE
jgi:hypothetical protein